MIRSQIQKQKQSIVHQNINLITRLLEQGRKSGDSFNDCKYICYIQICDYGEDKRREENKSFTNTFFGKIGKKISPKKRFYNTIMAKMKQNSSYEKVMSRKTETSVYKTNIISRQYSQRSSRIIHQLNNNHRIQDRIDYSLRRMQEIGTVNRAEQNQNNKLVKDIQKLRYSQNGYLQILKNQTLLPNMGVVKSFIKEQQFDKFTQKKEEIGQINQAHWNEQTKDKEESILKLRNKIKSKQSRKHIYHSLKHKSDSWNKINLKLHPNLNHAQRIRSQAGQQHRSMRLHCKQPTKSLKNPHLDAKNNNADPLFDNMNPLTIVSKPCLISLNNCSISQSFQTPNRQTLNSNEQVSDSSRLGSLNCKLKGEICHEIISSIKNNRNNKCHVGEFKTGNSAIQDNQFRLLTPWRGQEHRQQAC